jgi:putative oxidoreductase
MLSFKSLASMAEETLRRLSSFQWIAALLVRLFVGYFFFETGWAKLHNLDAFTARFMQWGIPHPAFNAALSAYTECIGGALTIAGLGTRLVSVPMMINMAVAIITVKMKNVTGLDDFVELDEPLYARAYLWLMFSGPGLASVDYLIRSMILRPASIPAAAEKPLDVQPCLTRVRPVNADAPSEQEESPARR